MFKAREMRWGHAVNRADLQRFANDRLADAKALLAAKRWTGAYYLAGYAVECALKACIAKLMKAEEFPDRVLAEKSWTHNLLQLVGVAGLKDDFAAARQAEPILAENWDTVKDWNESTRYARTSKADAQQLYEAISDKNHGVVPWLKLRW
jgi:HEPN domain-containing protein